MKQKITMRALTQRIRRGLKSAIGEDLRSDYAGGWFIVRTDATIESIPDLEAFAREFAFLEPHEELA